MKARHAFVVLGILGIVLGFVLSRGGGEREAREDIGLTDEPVFTEDATAELEAPAPVPEEAPADREELVVEEPGTPDHQHETAVAAPDTTPAESNEFHARVVDAATNEPLIGARATFDDGSPGEATTDANGFFRLTYGGLRAAIRVEHDEYAYRVIETRPEHTTLQTAATVRLSRSATLLVRVERAAGALAGLQVEAHTDGFWMRPREAVFSMSAIADPSWPGVLDASGTCTLAGLPPDVPLTVDVSEGSERLKRLPEVKLAAGEERELVIRIGTGCRVEGLALEPDGMPVPGLEIWLLSAEGAFRALDGHAFEAYDAKNVSARATCDDNGAFVFDDVSAGLWYVGPAPDEAGFGEDGATDGIAPVARVVQIAVGEELKEVRLELHRGLTISGRVLGPDGEEVSYAYVRLQLGAADHNSRDGTFTLGPLAPGEYTLIASPGGQGGYANAEPVKVRAGDQEVEIRFRRGGVIRVSVLGPDGQPTAAEGQLTPEDVQAAGFMMKSTSQQTDGVLDFNGLLPGVYHVKAFDALGKLGMIHHVNVEAGAEVEHELTLIAGARVVPRIEGREESDVVMPRVNQDGVSMGLHDFGTPVTVLPGAVTVELRRFDSASKEWIVLETRELTVHAGEEADVLFELPGDG